MKKLITFFIVVGFLFVISLCSIGSSNRINYTVYNDTIGQSIISKVETGEFQIFLMKPTLEWLEGGGIKSIAISLLPPSVIALIIRILREKSKSK
jgi:hypothetical protein